jgi:hypothetical protein
LANTSARPEPSGRRRLVLRPMHTPQKQYHSLLARALALYIERELPLAVVPRVELAGGGVEHEHLEFVVVKADFQAIVRELRPFDPNGPGQTRLRPSLRR